MKENCFTKFQASIDGYELPKRFTFPFYYEPDPLSVLAAEELQNHLAQNEWEHNFGLVPEKEGLIIGKMFGVLVVQNQAGEIGYLSAFSGKLADSNHYSGFVPPVFDMLTDGSFFNVGIVAINVVNHKIKVLEEHPKHLEFLEKIKTDNANYHQEISELKQVIKEKKAKRKKQRVTGKIELSEADYKALDIELSKESKYFSIQLKHLVRDWKVRLAKNEEELAEYQKQINILKQERKAKSGALQQKLFRQYRFLNIKGEQKDLLEIFTSQPPIAGSGECAAPKLLQYAFLHNMKPIAMAEFWWGEAPKSEVRKHGNFYPACRGKCKPILGHMLEGMDIDENPFLLNTALGKEIATVYEDDAIVVINKPTEFLSVPGKNVQDSVAFRMQVKYPNATGPMVAHRLDMSTSGLMLIAKTEEVYKYLQFQFIKRTIKKRYIAMLDGIIEADEGIINLPLRVDLEDRPRQLVCYEHGKNACTKWKVLERKDGKTRIHFFPITGRTHQLRVHAAHPLGLNMPIIGDDLYGKKTDRLYLHAAYIQFKHPVTKEMMEIELEADF